MAGGSPAARIAYVQLWWASTPAASKAVHGQQLRSVERDQRSGMAGQGRENALDHVVVVVFDQDLCGRHASLR